MNRNYATEGDLHFDVPLSNIAVQAFSDDTTDFIADKIFPAVPTPKKSDKYYTLTKAVFLRVAETLRAPRTRARRIEFSVSSDSFFCDNHALASDIPLEDLGNADTALQLRENTTRLVVGNLRRAQERRVANLVTSLTNLGSGTTLTGTAKWSDFVNSSPLSDITTAHAFIKNNTGLVANTMIIDYDTWMVVRRHPQFLDLFKYTKGGMLKMEELKELMNVANILVPSAIVENAIEGGTSSITSIWGNNVIVCHVGPVTGLQSQTFGLRFQWTDPIYPANFGVMRTAENGAGQGHVEVIEAGHFQDEKIVAAALAYGIAATL